MACSGRLPHPTGQAKRCGAALSAGNERGRGQRTRLYWAKPAWRQAVQRGRPPDRAAARRKGITTRRGISGGLLTLREGGGWMIPAVWKAALPVLGKGRLLAPGDPWRQDRHRIPLPGVAAKTREVRVRGARSREPYWRPPGAARSASPIPGAEGIGSIAAGACDTRRGHPDTAADALTRSRHNPAPNECYSTR
jgi:hypothetical protein